MPSTSDQLKSFEIIENVPLALRAELDRKIVSVRELMEFEEGTVVPLSRPAGENVDLYAGEVYVGSCEILVVEGGLAVRLADIDCHTVPESHKSSPAGVGFRILRQADYED
ncbi:MAG: FliM/FliN family flagellar motor switch protein [Acidobacteriaceae bacterium]|nr:FliM/FliN family flagellar motor switch protein [Acidobacteriaceae bacterium]